MKASPTTLLALAATVLATGCGNDESEPANPAAAPPKRELNVDKDPRKITCEDLSDPVASGRMSRQATFTLADEALARHPKLSNVSNRNQLAQRIFVGMTELCEDGDPALTPADRAVKGVAAGRYQLEVPDGKYVGE